VSKKGDFFFSLHPNDTAIKSDVNNNYQLHRNTLLDRAVDNVRDLLRKEV